MFLPKEPLEEIKHLAYPIKSEESFIPLLQKLGQARVVMLGEATHGTEEFYEMRRVISQKLIEDYGFNFIAVEGDWPDCYRLNRYIQTGEGGSAKNIMRGFKRWPAWLWANDQTAELIEWMHHQKSGFFGLDVYSLYESLEIVKAHAKKLEPRLSQQIIEAYACLEPFNRDELKYVRSLIRWPDECELEILQNLQKILELRVENTALHATDLFDMQQNAKIIRDAERYYRSMLSRDVESWNIRDEHMMDTLDALLRHYGENSKAIVWAHNTHIGDYRATDMLAKGYINLGGLARAKYEMEKVALVGFGTYAGAVLAGSSWEAEPQAMKLLPAKMDSYEAYFHRLTEQLRASSLYVLLNGEPALSLKKGHRAVGVVYQTEFEKHGRNYVPTELSRRYDAFVFVDQTTPLKALPGMVNPKLLPETWPTGT